MYTCSGKLQKNDNIAESTMNREKKREKAEFTTPLNTYISSSIYLCVYREPFLANFALPNPLFESFLVHGLFKHDLQIKTFNIVSRCTTPVRIMNHYESPIFSTVQINY